jgi:hypothetical protein
VDIVYIEFILFAVDVMHRYRVVTFQGQELRVLDLISGIEFISEDIFKIVSPYFHVAVNEITKSRFLENIPTKWRRRREIVIGLGTNEIQEFDTLCWLALNHIFKTYGYQDARKFIRWLRHDVVIDAAS